MNNFIAYKGFWFLPSKSDKKIAGILTIIPFESNQLELIGGFDDDFKNVLESEKQDAIFGEVYDSDNNFRKVTLFDCFSSFKINFPYQFVVLNVSVI